MQRVGPQILFSTSQVSGTSMRELPKYERAWQMIALTGDFYVFVSRVTTGFSAIFFTVGYIAQTGYVCALLSFLTRHYDSVLFTSVSGAPEHYDS
jgi:hypothetical protein